MEGISEAVPIDIENPCVITLETCIRKELDSLSPLSSSCCIYRVPERLRSVNEKAYTPNLVSIGPLHHGMKALEAMEEHKKRYLKDFLGRSEVSLEEYIQKIRGHEARLRSCYGETINLSSDEFVKMILVDAAFITELFLKYMFRKLRDEDDPIFRTPTGFIYLWPDFYLLENQLPLFILEDLFNPDKIALPYHETSKRLSILTLTLDVLQRSMKVLGVEEYVEVDTLSSSDCNVLHFVDLIRMLGRPMQSQVQAPFNHVFPPNLTELHRAGVKFKVGSSKNPFSMQFVDGILEIPKMQISDDTEWIFRNLIAFEQCHPVDQRCITEYISMIDILVNSPNDVDLLVRYKIVENLIGDSGEVSVMINRIGIGIYVHHNFRYSSLCNDLNEYCNSRCHKWKANLRQNYFNTPWATISVIAAVVLLILTLLQTVFTIYSPT